MKPKVSILLPLYNGDDFLHKCISSVINQTELDFELIVGDDVSTDNSAEIVGDFADKRIHYIRREVNLGLFHNLNDLVEKANAPFIRLLGQDDILEPDCIAKTIEFMESNPEIGISISRCIYIDTLGREVGRYPYSIDAFPNVLQSKLALQLFFYYGNLAGNITNVCFRKEAWQTVGGFNPDYGNPGDYEMWVRITQIYPLGLNRQFLTRVRLHEDQLSRTGFSPVHLERDIRVRADLVNKMPSSVQQHAKQYMQRAYHVKVVNAGIRWLIAGRWKYFRETIGILGILNFIIGFCYWLLSLNSRIHRPKALIHLDNPSVKLNLPRQKIIYEK